MRGDDSQLFAAVGDVGEDGWYVVETLHRKEPLALQNLAGQRLACFCPRFWQTRRHARRTDKVLAPLFPGYLFARFNPASTPWSRINGTLGVKRLVGAGQCRPAPMPAREIAQIQQRCTDGIVDRPVEQFEPGQPTCFVSGPFAGQLAKVEQLHGGDRVRLLMEMLGATVPVIADLASLAPARRH